MATKFFKQPRRGKSLVEQLTSHKAIGLNWGGFVTIVLLVLLATACNKPEKKELAGAWRWTSTTGGIAGVWFTPESEGFEAELVFNGSSFTLLKDGEKVVSGTYRIDYYTGQTLYTDKGDQDEPFYSWFNIRFQLTQAQHKKIAEATNGKISLGTLSKFIATLSHSDAEGQVFSMCEDGMYDGFCYTFVKK